VREFPQLVQLHRRFPEDVACLSFNMDYNGSAQEPPEKIVPRVKTFLEEHQATFDNVVSRETDEAILTRLKLAAVPAVLVFDREGQLRKRFDNDDGLYPGEGFTYADHVVPLVESLVQEVK